MTASDGRSAARPLRVVLILAVVIAGLTVLDRLLARTEMREVRGAAERSWKAGTRLLQAGHAGEALDALRNAHALARDNVTYELETIAALVALGRTGEADPLIDEVLQRRPNDGAANLMAGRLMAKEGDSEDAEAYYHRAIYGEWTGDAAAHERAARFELAQFLAREGSKQKLLAEVISLDTDEGADKADEQRIAQLFLAADSPGRAAAVYRALIAKNPDDVEAYEGLGEAELQQAQYRQARAAFMQASYRHQGAAVGPRLVLLNELIQLDPTPRRLPTAEKVERSVRILALAKGNLEAHLERDSTPANSEAAALLSSASEALAAVPGAVSNEVAEHNLDLATKIWKLRVRIFGPSTSREEEALRLTMERIASSA